MHCGSVRVHQKLLSENTCALQGDAGGAPQLAAGTSPPPSSSRPSSSSSGDAPQLAEPAAARRRSCMFKRAWQLRHRCIQVLAGRADCRCDCDQKKLVLADTTAFAQLVEPKAEIEHGEEMVGVFRLFCRRNLRRSLPSHGA